MFAAQANQTSSSISGIFAESAGGRSIIPLLREFKAGAILALSVASLGLAATDDVQARLAPGGDDRTAAALSIHVRPRSWLDAGNIVERGSSVAGLGNPVMDPQLIAASNQLTPVWGRNDRFDAGTLPDPITNGPLISVRW
ncbi:hypothetical protein PQI07_31885 [Methylobacterium sp. 092160098-2]|uniref:hypothetical protein n=1 Tax=Methylobacterium sp. 092160098-2 TaxID=3025129 RepID=UPI0023819CBF|nr:hypothetical protein [Methylobacterium sp. 092160098-2]MDE4915202.1 hypothetical protein [Methylobacterium sp. 092160098-2]